MKTAIISVLATLAVLAAIALGVIYTGAYNVAATAGHGALVEWALGTLQHSSVARRADDVTGQPPTDSAAVMHGFDHFHAMCVTCHGAPGIERGEMGQGIVPEPPELSDEAEEWTAAELFWITKHGIKLAGMPAFGPTHSDEQIWGIVAFLQTMPDMTAEEYQQWVDRLSPGPDSAGGAGGATHTHADGSQHEH